MPVAIILLFRALAHEGYGNLPGQLFDKAQRELLAMVFYRPAARINRAVHEQLSPVIAAELGPHDLIG